jgi:putative ABC transport system permease protein
MPRALLFTFGIALVTGFLFGPAPGPAGNAADRSGAFKSAGSKASGLTGTRILTGKSILVVTEVALAVVLLVGAGLMIQSFSRLMTTRTGVDPDRVRTVRISLPRDAKSPVVLSFFTELEKRVAALPG